MREKLMRDTSEHSYGRRTVLRLALVGAGLATASPATGHETGSADEHEGDDVESTESGEGGQFLAQLSGDQQVPPVETDATGSASVDLFGDTIEYAATVLDIRCATQIHLHEGERGENGPVVLTFAAFTAEVDGSGGGQPRSHSSADVEQDAIRVIDGVEDAALAERIRTNPEGFYVNVHTVANPDGEIRGQLETR